MGTNHTTEGQMCAERCQTNGSGSCMGRAEWHGYCLACCRRDEQEEMVLAAAVAYHQASRLERDGWSVGPIVRQSAGHLADLVCELYGSSIAARIRVAEEFSDRPELDGY